MRSPGKSVWDAVMRTAGAPHAAVIPVRSSGMRKAMTVASRSRRYFPPSCRFHASVIERQVYEAFSSFPRIHLDAIYGDVPSFSISISMILSLFLVHSFSGNCCPSRRQLPPVSKSIAMAVNNAAPSGSTRLFP